MKLIIFDVFSREVATIVNEQLKAGTYEVDFNGENCSSGVYYYRIETGDYIETKKMIFVK